MQSSTRIRLPANAGLVTDLQLPPPDCGSAPAAQRLVAVVARGAGLCLACPQADSVVASFKGLPTRAVSCSWVGSSSGGSSSSNGSSSSGGHLLLAGLEQGNLALLDVRRPDRPVAVLPVLANTQRCAQMPVRTVVALPAAPAGVGAAPTPTCSLWPTCAISCPRGAWLMVPAEARGAADDSGGTWPAATATGDGVIQGGGAAAAAGTALLQLDGGFGAGGNLQIESLAVHWQEEAAGSSGDAISGHSSGGGGGWRAALSWRPSHASGGGGPMAAGPRHEVGRLQGAGPVAFKHEVRGSGEDNSGRAG